MGPRGLGQCASGALRGSGKAVAVSLSSWVPKSLTQRAAHERARRSGRRAASDLNQAEQSQPFKLLVRVGFLARGLTYGVVGGLAIALACGAGTGGTQANQQGALALVASAPLGFVALVVIAAGLLAYAAWKLTQAILGRGPEGGGGPSTAERAANAGAGVGYLLFCAVAIRILAGSGSGGSSGGSPKHAAAGVLGWPGGQVLVCIAGIALIAGCAYQVHYALAGKFSDQAKTDEMSTDERRLFCVVGRVGLIARAVVFALCGYFLAQAAITYDSANAVGVDGALARLHHQSLGPWIVGLVGVGLLVFAGFSLYEARYRRL